MKPSQASYVPSHPDHFLVQFSSGDFNSSLISLKAFGAGDSMVPFTGLTRSPKAYTSVQCGPGHGDHIELNSDLVYVNHSCEPNVAFDLSSDDPSYWHVRAMKDIKVGDTCPNHGSSVTFFYPSTEWDMEQPFDCACGTESCLGLIQGAAQLSLEELNSRGFINAWIKDLVTERDKDVLGPSFVELQGPVPDINCGVACTACGYGFSARGDVNFCGCKRIAV